MVEKGDVSTGGLGRVGREEETGENGIEEEEVGRECGTPRGSESRSGRCEGGRYERDSVVVGVGVEVNGSRTLGVNREET